MPTIRLEQVTKRYKWEDRWYDAVTQLDLTIEQGEFIFVVGSSGAGKSTLLKLIARELVPEEGSIFLDDMDMAWVPPWFRSKLHLQFGRVWQESHLIRKRTIRENLEMVARLTDKRHMREKMDKALALVGMSGIEDKYPGELSIGECRRIELARAMVNSPPILLLDELTANLDDDNIWDILHLLTEISRQGTTVIMATHNSTTVNIMRRRVVTLVDGRIAGDVKRGRYGDIKSKPLKGPRTMSR